MKLKISESNCFNLEQMEPKIEAFKAEFHSYPEDGYK